ncbi:MAG: glutamine--fructose-6-phosphate transaminase (isomerizing), partial [Clostridiales bacterium]|nr:glutamine--fructose-6-phosphate transaminase (isomerizing) [Clostridiales bacterium]
MCGIIGYTGGGQAVPVLTRGLKALEYRGYDSAGVAVAADKKNLVVKKKGRVSELEKALAAAQPRATCGIGHTRWATHGEPSDQNAHPQSGPSGAIAVVHNGIIENYHELKRELADSGGVFYSETDTEAVAHLIEKYYEGDLRAAVFEAAKRLCGSYAIAVLCADFPDTIVAAACGSPLIVGTGDGETYLASDAPALPETARALYRMKDGEIAVLRPSIAEFFDRDGLPVTKTPLKSRPAYAEARLDGAESFMIKEIGEIPKALSKTAVYYRGGFFEEKETAEVFSAAKKIFIVGCGTAYHAGLIGRALIEKIAKIPVETDLASEFRYREPLITQDSLCIFISQSGETADTLAAAALARQAGALTVCITNVAESALTAACRLTLPTLAGPEIAVASTKAYNCQLLILYRLAFCLGRLGGKLGDAEYSGYITALESAAAGIETSYPDIPAMAQGYKNNRDLYFLGRGLDYFTALEGSLKLKEISYTHCEAYASGELKHGALALIEDGTPVIATVTQAALLKKSLNSLEEVKARKAQIIGIGKAAYLT